MDCHGARWAFPFVARRMFNRFAHLPFRVATCDWKKAINGPAYESILVQKGLGSLQT